MKHILLKYAFENALLHISLCPVLKNGTPLRFGVFIVVSPSELAVEETA